MLELWLSGPDRSGERGLMVGASLLAMVVNDNAYLLAERGALESIASELAPTTSLTEQHYPSREPSHLHSVQVKAG